MLNHQNNYVGRLALMQQKVLIFYSISFNILYIHNYGQSKQNYFQICI